jgi:Peptidase S24-like
MENVRETLERLIRERGDDYLSISRLLGRNSAYIQQFLKRGVPRKLDEDDRRLLASYFGVDEQVLGSPLGPGPASGLAEVPQLSIGASAGSGTVIGEEGAKGRMGFDPRWLKKLAPQTKKLSMIQVAGDSMEPTLSHGDDIMVDASAASEPLRDGLYVIRHEDVLLVKRLTGTNKAKLSIVSDNPAYPPVSRVDPAALTIIGRVIWAGRRVS